MKLFTPHKTKNKKKNQEIKVCAYDFAYFYNALGILTSEGYPTVLDRRSL